MRAFRFRVRTLMAAMALVTVLIWAAMMGWRSFVYYRLASHYALEESVWRKSTARGDWRPEVGDERADYFAQLARKYRRAIWRPWLPVAPDPIAPGVKEFLEQERRKPAHLRDPLYDTLKSRSSAFPPPWSLDGRRRWLVGWAMPTERELRYRKNASR